MSDQTFVFVGIDVSAKSFAVAGEKAATGECWACELDNNFKGHQQLIRRLSKRSDPTRVCLESTGVYGLDLALALFRAEGIEVMMVNPRAARNFAKALMQRSKTDPVDARVLLEFARRMDFRPWSPPAQEVLELRTMARRTTTITEMMTQEKNRLHAAQATDELEIIRNDIEVNIRHFERRLLALQTRIVALIEDHPGLQVPIARLTSIKGVALVSAVRIYAEIAVLPRDMKPRQWVAHAGLDPRHFQSGDFTGKVRISKAGNKYLRAALYMPALTAIQFEPNVRAFRDKLVGKGKKKIQAVVAVMRKLLHSIFGMLQHNADFDGKMFYNIPKNA